MTTTPVPARRFTSDMLAGLEEPVRRYFGHAIGDGAALPNGVRMAMSGRIKVGLGLARDPVSRPRRQHGPVGGDESGDRDRRVRAAQPEVRVSIDEHGAEISAVTPTL